MIAAQIQSCASYLQPGLRFETPLRVSNPFVSAAHPLYHHRAPLAHLAGRAWDFVPVQRLTASQVTESLVPVPGKRRPHTRVVFRYAILDRACGRAPAGPLEGGETAFDPDHRHGLRNTTSCGRRPSTSADPREGAPTYRVRTRRRRRGAQHLVTGDRRFRPFSEARRSVLDGDRPSDRSSDPRKMAVRIRAAVFWTTRLFPRKRTPGQIGRALPAGGSPDGTAGGAGPS